jgi:hypothetical protein
MFLCAAPHLHSYPRGLIGEGAVKISKTKSPHFLGDLGVLDG